MPNIIDNTSGLDWYSFVSSGSGYPYNSDEAKNNAFIVYNMCRQLGWSVNAIAALCGNIQGECDFNPAQTELDGYGGYGLMQWTPSTDLTNVLDVIYPEGYSLTDGTQQMNAIFAEYYQTNYAQGNSPSYNYGIEQQWYNSSGSSYQDVDGSYGLNVPAISWNAWATGDYDVETLTKSFMCSYLRPGYSLSVSHLDNRIEYARWWYSVFTGEEPPEPIGGQGDINSAIQWAINTCNRENVGYSQEYRNEETVNGITYYDCSSFIWFALKAGNFDVVTANNGDTWPFTTDTMPDVLPKLGFVQVPLDGEWKQGDIGLNADHTEMVYQGGTGRGICMGAHTANALLENQVSIGSSSGDPTYESDASRWTSLWRYKGGSPSPIGKTKKGLPIWMMIRYYV